VATPATYESQKRLNWKLTDPIRVRDPIRQVQKWLDLARAAGVKEPTAMTLATTTADGKPSARVVLLKGIDHRGFIFYTNYLSRKGRELAGNPRAALVLYWPALDRQVRVTGRVSKLSAAESDEYFNSRPAGSRFSAAVSPQSSVIQSRAALERRLAKLKVEYPDAAPPRPKHWGGYVVRPTEIEFWQQGENRLHHRLRYRSRGLRGGVRSWNVEQLAP
jgi:pyridoxamine 5'-phosphate oxidase